jgi:hypothetical protein
MRKILQVIIIPVLLCANLLGDEYGVEKWPTLLGSSLEWGMTDKEASSIMKKKGFRFHEKIIDVGASEVLSEDYYKGRFAGSNAVVSLLSINGRLGSMTISLGLTEPIDGFKKPLLVRPHTRPLQKALKLRDSMVKQYGKPSKEVFFEEKKGKDRGDLITRRRLKNANYVSKDKALSERFKDIYYFVDYKTKVGDVSYMDITCNNYGTLEISANGPIGVKFFRRFQK